MSLPVRGRGLKRAVRGNGRRQSRVAPRAGAWIETSRSAKPSCRASVAPRAGAWIETGRGVSFADKIQVAPRAGAWIETLPVPALTIPAPLSLPVRGRGLKHIPGSLKIRASASLPVRGRGLKPTAPAGGLGWPAVAPRAGAWIET